MWYVRLCCVFFFQAEDGIRDAQESRGLGDVYKRQIVHGAALFMAVGLQGSSRWVLGQIGASFSEAAPWLSNNPDMRQHIHDTSSEQGINAALSAQDAQVAASATTTGTAGGGAVRPQRSPHSCHLAPQPTKQDEVVCSQTSVSSFLVGGEAVPP
eukprot:TRINITY_DN23422_c0_g1_i1.p1 TRINITY_DN23422_c0_g1~~TRINITY_DN23422_c0_g1_i1.p1  ORF type:complete len:155 (+),score=21.96 TRINITY_DN23422_c0_g1_i1:37-501(+)